MSVPREILQKAPDNVVEASLDTAHVLTDIWRGQALKAALNPGDMNVSQAVAATAEASVKLTEQLNRITGKLGKLPPEWQEHFLAKQDEFVPKTDLSGQVVDRFANTANIHNVAMLKKFLTA